MKKLVILTVLVLIILYGLSQNTNFTKEVNNIKSPTDVSKAYCPSTYSNTTDDWITNVTFHTIDNSTSQDGANSYGDYTYQLTGLLAGNTYILSVSFSSGSFTQHVRAWFDWNDDDDFLDDGETYYLGDGNSTTLSISITVPLSAEPGLSRMRIIEQYNADPGWDHPCDPHSTIYGETEDYSIHIATNNYCNASGGCDEYISSVLLSSSINYLDHGSSCEGYLDWFGGFVQIPLNSSGNITITNGNPYPPDQCGVWVDWNRDDDFYDANETIVVTGTPGVGPYTATLTPPAGSTPGKCYVRVRITYTGANNPCGTTTFGEVEDFQVTLINSGFTTWTGAVDNNWHNSDNWAPHYVPDATTDVIIQDVPNKCWIYEGSAFCNNITVEYGSGNDLKVSDQFFRAYGDFDMYGQLSMDHDDAWILTEGNFTWHSGSTANILADALIQVEGDWTFMSGANVHLDNGGVTFEGSGNSYIHSHDENCYFNDLGVYKLGSSLVKLSFASTEDLHIHGYLNNFLGTFEINSQESLFLQGNLINMDTFEGNTIGTLVFNGSDQAILTGSGANTMLGSTTINSSNKTEIVGDAISFMGVLTIQSGQFITNDTTKIDILSGTIIKDINCPPGTSDIIITINAIINKIMCRKIASILYQ